MVRMETTMKDAVMDLAVQGHGVIALVARAQNATVLKIQIIVWTGEVLMILMLIGDPQDPVVVVVGDGLDDLDILMIMLQKLPN